MGRNSESIPAHLDGAQEPPRHQESGRHHAPPRRRPPAHPNLQLQKQSAPIYRSSSPTPALHYGDAWTWILTSKPHENTGRRQRTMKEEEREVGEGNGWVKT